MRSLSAKAVSAVFMGVALAVALIGFAWNYEHDRARIRDHAAAITGGDPVRGEAMFINYGCGSCHTVTGVRTAIGNVGPPLDDVATRVIIAGRFANTPENMEQWIRQPQQVSPGTAMPDLAVSEGDARDITAFLYTRTE
jgi:cytochrome c2